MTKYLCSQFPSSLFKMKKVVYEKLSHDSILEQMIFCILKAAPTMLSRKQNAEECDATEVQQ